MLISTPHPGASFDSAVMSACISVSWTVFGAITMTEIRKHFTLNPIKEEVMFFVMFVYVCVRVLLLLPQKVLNWFW